MVSQYNVRLWKTRVDRGSGRRLSEGSETFNQYYTNIEVFGSYQNTLVEHENITKVKELLSGKNMAIHEVNIF